MIGSNLSLRPGGSNPPPGPVLKMAPPTKPISPGQSGGGYGGGYAGQSSIRKPQYISDEATEEAANNALAQGIQQGDQRFQMKQLDKAGISRGKGQAFLAAQSGQQHISQGAAQAAGIRAEDQRANSQMEADYENMREQQAHALAMNAHARSQADWARQFAQQQAAAQLLMTSLMTQPRLPQKKL